MYFSEGLLKITGDIMKVMEESLSEVKHNKWAPQFEQSRQNDFDGVLAKENFELLNDLQ